MDRTQTALVIVFLAIIVIASMLLSSGAPGSVVPAQAGIAAPGTVLAANSIGAWLLKALGVLVGLLALIAAGFYGYDLVKRRAAGNWLPGPGARWQRGGVQQPPTEPKTSATDLLVALALRQAIQGGGMGYQPPAPMKDGENQPLEF